MGLHLSPDLIIHRLHVTLYVWLRHLYVHNFVPQILNFNSLNSFGRMLLLQTSACFQFIIFMAGLCIPAVTNCATSAHLAQATLISEIDHLSLKYREQKGLVFHCSFISRWQVRELQLVVAVQADQDLHALILGPHSHGFTMQPTGSPGPLHLPRGGELPV